MENSATECGEVLVVMEEPLMPAETAVAAFHHLLSESRCLSLPNGEAHTELEKVPEA